ncbi:hypothetical protein K438DRAFT_2051431 [Mycena galopus ATCC 62051]|nr:hypothetical protein K438DRAFT_2051431 [Mycena galopus ATCC 62051]
MSTSKLPAALSAPHALKRRRTLMACLSCRKRKIRCITTEKPPKNPCARCTKKHLLCEYVPATETEQDEHYSSHSGSPQTPEFPQSELPAISSSPSLPPSRNPSPYPSPGANQSRGSALPLPHTIPPPPGYRPRFAGMQYPDLSLLPQSAPMALRPMLMQHPYYTPTATPHPNTNPYLSYPPYSPHPGRGSQYPWQQMSPPHPSHPQQFAYAPMPGPFFAGTRVPTPDGDDMFDWPESEDSSTNVPLAYAQRYHAYCWEVEILVEISVEFQVN